MPGKIKRRRFLETAGRIGAGAVLGSIPLIDGCKGGPTTPDEPPEPPVPVDLDFTVYNHTQGPRGTFSRMGVMSGTTQEISVSTLISELAISDVYDKAVVIRETESGTRVGVTRDSGKAFFLAPRKSMSYQVFLFNAAGAQLYESAVRWQMGPLFGTSIKAYRGDFDGRTGEERVWGGEFVPEIGEYGVFDQLNKALKPEWATWNYGTIERRPVPNDASGDFCYGFADCGSYIAGFFIPDYKCPDWFCGIDPQRIPEVKSQVGKGLAIALAGITGTSFERSGDPVVILQEEGILRPAARDFLPFWLLVM